MECVRQLENDGKKATMCQLVDIYRGSKNTSIMQRGFNQCKHYSSGNRLKKDEVKHHYFSPLLFNIPHRTSWLLRLPILPARPDPLVCSGEPHGGTDGDP
jgi:hypothetical protein